MSEEQPEQQKHEKLKKFIDVIAFAAVAYPFVLMFGVYFLPKDTNMMFVYIAGLGMFAMIPAIFWLNYRQNTSPPGTYPLLDKWDEDRWFAVRSILIVVLFTFLSQSVLVHYRNRQYNNSQNHTNKLSP